MLSQHVQMNRIERANQRKFEMMEAEIKAQAEVISRMQATFRDLGAGGLLAPNFNGAAPDEVPGRDDELVDSFDASADEQDVNNLYSFCMEMSLSAVDRIMDKDRADTDAHLGFVIFMCSLKMFILVAVQVILTFGYFDSSLLAGVTNDLPAFGDPVPIPIFYAHSVLPNTALPLINCMCSVASMGLLGILMKNDNEGTLLTSCPLALLILCPPKFWRNQSCCNVLYQVITCIWLQALCFCRALFLPLYAGIGAAGNYAGSQSAQDIVLNSVAIGFVFDLDEFLYQSLLSRSRRYKFEATPPRSSSPLSPMNPQGKYIASLWVRPMFVLDVCFGLYVYKLYADRTFGPRSPQPPGGLIIPDSILGTAAFFERFYHLPPIYFMSRLGVYCAAVVHLSRVCAARTQPLGEFVLRACLFTICCVLLGFLMFTFLHCVTLTITCGNFGFGFNRHQFSVECGIDVREGNQCTELHKQPGKLAEIANLTPKLYGFWTQVFWGVRSFLDFPPEYSQTPACSSASAACVPTIAAVTNMTNMTNVTAG